MSVAKLHPEQCTTLSFWRHYRAAISNFKHIVVMFLLTALQKHLFMHQNPRFLAYPQPFIHSSHVTHDKQSAWSLQGCCWKAVYSVNNGYRGLGQTKMFSLQKLVRKNRRNTFWMKRNTNKNDPILLAWLMERTFTRAVLENNVKSVFGFGSLPQFFKECFMV